MCVLWRFIAVLVLVGLGVEARHSLVNEQEQVLAVGSVDPVQRGSTQLSSGPRIEEEEEDFQPRPLRKKRSRWSDDDGGADSPLWKWLTGRDEPNRCVMVSVGGVIGGGALTGAFVGAGIGSIFTGPGTVVGALVGGVVGMFGGISFGHRAGAAACDTSCGSSRCY